MILDEIIIRKRIRVEGRKKIVTLETMYSLALKENEKNTTKDIFMDVLSKEGLSVIGEFKKASPSKGIIVESFNIEEILKVYKQLDIDAYSVLTEEDYFKGNDEYLKLIKAKSLKPILRKDFIIDFYQIYEAKILGACGILLIVAVLGEKLGEFYEECKRFDLEPLVEVHNIKELKIALKYDVKIIGINNRDLNTFKTNIETTEELIKYIPEGKIVVSESGINNIDDLNKIKKAGADAVLIGEMFMRNLNNDNFKNEFIKFKGCSNVY